MEKRERIEKVENDVGTIRIADEVVAIIAGMAATEISGVAGMSAGLVGGIAEMLGKKNLAKGVKVEVGEREAAVDLYIIVEYGVRIPDIALRVQENVKRGIESMTGLDVVEVNARQVGTPGRHRLAVEQAQPLQAQVQHPLRLVLQRGDVADHVLVQAALGRSSGGVGIAPAVLVAAQCRQVLVLGLAETRGGRGCRGHDCEPFLLADSADTTGCGTWVVHTPSPWAMVASRWTWESRSREKARVSASHSCGNSAAT